MSRYAALAGAGAISLALLAYSINFNEWAGLSADESAWGAFGDFVGGFSNPVLTFITMCLLIQSLNFQRVANESLISQGNQAQALAKRQRVIDDLRSFESTFFSLSDVARAEYERLQIVSGINVYDKAQAVDYIERVVLAYAERQAGQGLQPDFKRLFDRFDDQSNMSIYSCVRGFHVLFKFASESSPADYKDRYVEICTSLMPVKMLNLICLARAFEDWDSLDYLSSQGFFSIKGIDDYYRVWFSLR